MYLGILSDLHANPYALEVALAYLKKRSVGAIVCAGDLSGYSPLVNETIALFRAHDIACIIGNHDNYVMHGCPDHKNAVVKECIGRSREIISPDNLDFLRSLDTSKVVRLGGRRIKLVHGSPFDLLEEYIYPDKPIDPQDYRLDGEDLLILGHTHHQMIKASPDFIMVNPGSVGQPRDAYGHACLALYDTTTGQVEAIRLPYDTRGILQALEQAGWPPVLGKYFKTGAGAGPAAESP